MIGAGVFAVSGVLLVAGCNSGGGSSKSSAAASPTSTLAADVPAGYDPCTDIPQSVLDQLQWTMKITRKNSAADGTVWRGCGWSKVPEYAVTVYMTNATIETVRSKHLLDPAEFTVDGRNAILTIQDPDHPSTQCTVDVSVKGGSLEIFLSNSDASDPAGSTDSVCTQARDVAKQITSTLPSTL
jgi:hypothetical protein